MYSNNFPLSTLLAAGAAIACCIGTPASAENPELARQRIRAFEATEGYAERGADIHPSQLDRYLPPPPRDALPYEVREPLRNGRTVPVKKRWLWVPETSRITFEKLIKDGVEVDHIEVPEGAMWWKEFYIETSQGSQLVERRLLRKLAGKGEWRLYTAHYLPEGADGVSGNVQDIVSFLWTPESSAYFFRPEEWMPTVPKSAPTQVTFYDNTGAEFPYVFPGRTACTRCHNGAAAAYDEADGERTIAFGLHPRNLTARSIQNFIEQGLFAGDSFAPVLAREEEAVQEEQRARVLLRPANALHADKTELMEAKTKQLLAVFRNNCVSCHNFSPIADARVAAFKLDPNRDYSTRELVEALGQSSKRGPSTNGFPLITPGRPDQSELYLRLLGIGGRQRMPLAEGGLPEQDPFFLSLIEDWIVQLGEAEAAPGLNTGNP